MRTLLLLFICLTASAQNTAVRWSGTNSDGIPFYWPIILQSVGTNTAFGGAIVLTPNELETVIRTNRTAFIAGRQAAAANVLSNKLYVATSAISNVVWGANYIEANWETTTLAQKRSQLTQLRNGIGKLVPIYEQMTQLLLREP